MRRFAKASVIWTATILMAVHPASACRFGRYACQPCYTPCYTQCAPVCCEPVESTCCDDGYQSDEDQPQSPSSDQPPENLPTPARREDVRRQAPHEAELPQPSLPAEQEQPTPAETPRDVPPATDVEPEPAEPAAPGEPATPDVDETLPPAEPETAVPAAPAEPAPKATTNPPLPATPADPAEPAEPAAPPETPTPAAPPVTTPAPASTPAPADDVEGLFDEPKADTPAEPAPAEDQAKPDAAAPAEPKAEEKADDNIDELFNEPAEGEKKAASTKNEFRIWTDNTGNYQTRARILTVLDGKVRLLKDTGRTTTVSLDRLSKPDLAFVLEYAGNGAKLAQSGY